MGYDQKMTTMIVVTSTTSQPQPEDPRCSRCPGREIVNPPFITPSLYHPLFLTPSIGAFSFFSLSLSLSQFFTLVCLEWRPWQEAKFIYNVMLGNMHQDDQIASVAFKDAITPPEVNVIHQNNMNEWDNTHAIMTNVQEMMKGKRR